MGLFFATLAVVKNRTEGLPSIVRTIERASLSAYDFLDREGQENIKQYSFRMGLAFQLRGLLFSALRIAALRAGSSRRKVIVASRLFRL